MIKFKFSVQGGCERCYTCDSWSFHGDAVYDAVLLGHNIHVAELSFPDISKEYATSRTDYPGRWRLLPEERSFSYTFLVCFCSTGKAIGSRIIRRQKCIGSNITLVLAYTAMKITGCTLAT